MIHLEATTIDYDLVKSQVPLILKSIRSTIGAHGSPGAFSRQTASVRCS